MRTPKFTKTRIEGKNDIYEGQSIERYVEQCEVSKQPIEGGAPIIFTARKDGIMAQYNIRTDRFQIAQNAMDKAAKTAYAKRVEYMKKADTKDGEAEPTQAS